MTVYLLTVSSGSWDSQYEQPLAYSRDASYVKHAIDELGELVHEYGCAVEIDVRDQAAWNAQFAALEALTRAVNARLGLTDNALSHLSMPVEFTLTALPCLIHT